MPRPTLVYDGECAFCRWSLAQLLRRDGDERLRIVALQSPEAAELLPHLTPAQRAAAAHLVSADGRVYSGAAVAAPLVQLLGGGARIAAVLRVLAAPSAWGYRLIAANRGLLSRALPADAKRRASAFVARRLARS
jgi:predicted DCC family thiol-disulfide oxidoreductase YuxK